MNGKADGEGVFFTRPEKSQLEKWRHWLLGTNSLKVEELNEKPPVQDADESQQMGLF